MHKSENINTHAQHVIFDSNKHRHVCLTKIWHKLRNGGLYHYKVSRALKEQHYY